MPKKRLTEEGVHKLKPPPMGKQIDYFDAGMPGLVLRVNYGGMKVWRALYYVKVVKNDKRVTEPRTRKLGRYPILKLKEARDAARNFLADPQKALTQANAGTFKEVAELFIKRHVDADKDHDRDVPLRSKPEIVRCLNKYVYPQWEHKPFRELKRSDVTALLDQIQDNNGPRQADAVLAIIGKMMNWYAARNDDYMTPIVRGMKRTNAKNRQRNRFLDNPEILTLWKACDDMGTYGAIVKCLLVTGQRRDKVACMKRDEVKDGKWIIPIEPREKSNAGTLRLPQIVLDIMNAQPIIADNPYVFTAGAGNGPFNSFSQRKQELDAKLPKQMKAWVLHDLRRTCRKLMTRAGVRADVGELALGHSIKGIQAIYDDPIEYGPMIDHALQCVANQIDDIINPKPENVTALSSKRRRRG